MPQTVTSPILLRKATLDLERAEVLRTDGDRLKLTPREVELLAYLATHSDRTVSREELLGKVWGYAPTTVSRAVDTTVRRLREKIEADPQRPDHLITAFGAGYRLLIVADAPEESEPREPREPRELGYAEDEPFVGRAAERALIVSALSEKAQTALLQGPPGVGKTALAGRCAPLVAGGTVIAADLADLRDPSDVAFAVARALGISTVGTQEVVLQRAGEALRACGRCVVLLDNCDGLGEAVARALAIFEETAKDARFLVTSREEIGGIDLIVRLSPLSPDESMALFEALVQRLRPQFRADDSSREILAQLMERLDHLPLAIRLAAGRAAALSPRALLARLDGQLARSGRGEIYRFQLLASRERGGVARHQSLRASLDTSWELLSQAERDVLAACSAFRGGFDPQAAAEVTAVDDAPALLDSLRRHSLLERKSDRYGGYLSVREYAAERLAEDPARERAVFRRHAELYHRRLSQGGETLSSDRANLACAVERGNRFGWADLAGETAVGLLDLVGREGPCELGIAIARSTLSLGDLALRDRIRIGLRLASLEQWTGDGDAMQTLSGALDQALASNELDLVASAYRTRAMIVRTRFGAADALPDLRLAEQISRVCGQLTVWGTCAASLAGALRESGALMEAKVLLEEVVLRADEDSAAHALIALAPIERRCGRYEAARALYANARARKERLRDHRGVALVLLGLGNLEIEIGRLTEARAAYEASLTLAEQLGLRELSARAWGNLGLVERLSARTDAARELLVRAHAHFEHLGEARMAAAARGSIGAVEMAAGRFAVALPLLEDAVHVLQRHRDPGALEHEAQLVEALLALGEIERASALMPDLELRARRMGEPLLLGLVLVRRAMLSRARGEDAAEMLREAESCATGLSPDAELRQLIARTRQTADVQAL